MIIKALQQNWRIETNRDRERKIERHKDRFLNEWQKRSFIRGTLWKKVGNLRLLMRRFHSFSTVNTSISDRLTLDIDFGIGSWCWISFKNEDGRILHWNSNKVPAQRYSSSLRGLHERFTANLSCTRARIKCAKHKERGGLNREQMGSRRWLLVEYGWIVEYP